jgi:hypothetical protein
MNIFALAIGTVTAVITVLLFKAWRFERTRWAYPVLLATFPVNYCVFAIYASDLSALREEVVVGMAFLALAYAGFRFRSSVALLSLAVGYVLHAVYDYYHDQFIANAGVPVWWPEFCGAVDVLLGAFIAYLAFSSAAKTAVPQE